MKRPSRSILQSFALILVCIYACTLYIGYINGTFLSLQSLCLYGTVGMTVVIVIHKGYFKLNQYLLWFMGFIALSIISCLYAENMSKAFSGAYSLVIVWIFCFALTMIIETKRQIEYFLIALVIGSVILTGYLQFSGMFETMSDTANRFGEELTGNANVFAAVYMIAAAASVYFILGDQKKIYKILAIVAFAVQLYALSMSGGRKYFLFPFILMYIMSLQKKTKEQRTHMVRNTLIAVVILIVVYYLLMNVEFLYETIGYRFEDLFNYTTGESDEAEVGTLIREAMIERGWELWLESPVLGHGLNMFSEISGFGVYSHNNFIEILCNHGLVGFAWYYGFYIYAIVKLWKNKRVDNMKRFLIAFVICLFVYEYGAISYNTLITQVFLVFAMLYDRICANEIQNENTDLINA